MENSRIMTALYNIAREMGGNEFAAFEKFTKSREFKTQQPGLPPVVNLAALYTALMIEEQEQSAKKSGRGNLLKAAKKIIASADTNARPVLKYAPIINGKQYVCNGIALLEFDPIDGLDAEIPRGMEYPNIQRIFSSAEDVDQIPAPLPDISELKQALKNAKAAKKKAVYALGENLPVLDGAALLNVMEGGYAEYAISRESAGVINKYSVILRGSSGRALLMPIYDPHRAAGIYII